jgi:hypothetical protein
MTSAILDSAEPLYRDPSRPIEERVDDLLARMTTAEKAAQLGSAWVFQLADASGLCEDRAAALLADGLGQVTRVCGASSLGPRRRHGSPTRYRGSWSSAPGSASPRSSTRRSAPD